MAIDPTEAEMIRQLLALYGIQCSVSSEVPHTVLPFTVDGLGEVRVHVPAAAIDEARAILAAQRQSGEAAPSEHPRETGVVVVRRDGRRRLYRTDRARLAEVTSALESMWRGDIDRLAAVAEASERAKRGGV